jgi:hypothetical protein
MLEISPTYVQSVRYVALRYVAARLLTVPGHYICQHVHCKVLHTTSTSLLVAIEPP